MPDFGTAIQEGVLAAAFTVAKSAQANANITVTAVVTDTSRKREGIYKVRSDGAEFDAYSENGTYYKNESVLVQIPNNDYTGRGKLMFAKDFHAAFRLVRVKTCSLDYQRQGDRDV